MAPIRIRHAQGTSTIEIDLDTSTVLELQQEIRKVTNILPSLQEVKTGFPPRSITLISELPISSLGLKRGDQLIVNELKATPTSSAPTPAPAPVATPSATRGRVPQPNPPPPQPAPKSMVPAFQPAPTADPQPTRTASLSSAPDEVTTSSGILVHRIVPDDNSCLFSSIGIVFEQDMQTAPKMRQLVADVIKADPVKYDDVTLGRSRDEYVRTILSPSAWGGAIELAVFCQHYNTEITSIDVETGRCDRYGEDQYPSRAILLYSGIHYDAVSLSPMPDAPLDFHTTIFPVSDQSILDGASALAAKLRAKRAYTNTATFDLRCEICKIGLKGEKGAREHATQTGHAKFGEY